MAWKKIAIKKYVVRLSAEEREQLASLIRSGKRSAQLLTKARILLKADVSEAGEGWSDNRIAEALSGHQRCQYRTNATALAGGRVRGRAAEAKLIALACGPAPAGYTRWTLSLLEKKVVELNIVEKASGNTIGRTLKKTFSNSNG